MVGGAAWAVRRKSSTRVLWRAVMAVEDRRRKMRGGMDFFFGAGILGEAGSWGFLMETVIEYGSNCFNTADFVPWAEILVLYAMVPTVM